MIDFHTHILPGIDDGAQNVAQSATMLRLLEEDGVHTVVCTPHFYWGKYSIREFLRMRDEALKKLSFSPLQLVPAAEVEFGELTIDYSQFSRLRVGDTDYILLELPYTETWSSKLFLNIRQLMQETGLRPIIAHIDRYIAVGHHPSYVEELLSMGCLLQVNTEAVIHSKAHSLVDVLLRYGQVQLLGSDCHNDGVRAPHYRNAIKKLVKRYSQDCVNFLQGTMQEVLANQQVEVEYFHSVKKCFGFYR